MSTTRRWQLDSRGVYAGSAWLPERARFHCWLPACALAGIMILSLAVLPPRVLAGEATSVVGSPVGGEAIDLPEVGPGVAKSSYVPRVIGLGRHRRHAGGVGKARPALGDVECPACEPLGVYEADGFERPTRINNRWLPLKPGTQMVLQGQSNRGGGLLPHLVIFTVTDLVKTINGIDCVVVWDRDINEGVLVESELAFFAQHENGDVWNSGEYPEEYENGEFIGAENTWIHGIEYAVAGVTVQQRSIVGTPGYQEAIAPENDFWDCGLVFARSKERTCVPAGCFRNTLTIREWAPFDGCDVIQIKTYAKGVGIIQVGALDDPEGETLVLAQINHLNRTQMREAREAALALDAHGPEVNKIYSQTEPARRAEDCEEDDDDKGLNALTHPAGRDDDCDDDDDKGIVALEKAAVAPSRTFMSIGPNPVTTSTDIAYGIVQAGPVEVGIFDVAGRRIRSLVDESVAPGTYRVRWDGLDDEGNDVARGVYFARLRTGAQVVGRTVVVGR